MGKHGRQSSRDEPRHRIRPALFGPALGFQRREELLSVIRPTARARGLGGEEGRSWQ